jgi:hypothetical protein
MRIWGAGWFFMGIKQWASGRGYIYPISPEIGGCGDGLCIRRRGSLTRRARTPRVDTGACPHSIYAKRLSYSAR